MTTADRILEILAKELEYTMEELQEEKEISMESLPEWDSLTHTQLILALEKAFDIRLAAAPASQASDIAALVDLVDLANS